MSAGDFQPDARKKLLNEIRPVREARRIVPEIALLEGKRLRDLKKPAFNGAGYLRGLESHWSLLRHGFILCESV
jgi:hypothetical protein